MLQQYCNIAAMLHIIIFCAVWIHFLARIIQVAKILIVLIQTNNKICVIQARY